MSQSTIVLSIIGMDEVPQHHDHTFEKSHVNFQFQCEFNSVMTTGSYGQHTRVPKKLITIITREITKFIPHFSACCC